MDEQGIEQLAVAPVPGETRLVGVMTLGDRLGAAASFSPADLRLFETLAGHAGMSLEFDRLEQAIRRMRALQGALERQAFRDPLTDLANRALFMRRVHESLDRRSGTTTVLFLDLDDFKRVNDHAGHAAGDAVLIAAAERIRRCVRPTDLAARLGGDEFAVLLEDADERLGEEIAHRIVALLSEAVTISGRPVLGARLDRDQLHGRRLGHGCRRPDAPRRHRDVPREGGGQGAGPGLHAGDAPELPHQGALARRAARRARRRPVHRPLPADRRGELGRDRGRRGARALEPSAARAALAFGLRSRRGADRDDPGDRSRRARAGMPRGLLPGPPRTDTRRTRPCT